MSHDNFSSKNKVREKPYNAVTAEPSGADFTYLWSNIAKFSPLGRK